MNDAERLHELKQLLPQCLLKDQLRIGLRLAAWLRDHRHESAAPPALARWLADARASVIRRQERLEHLPAIHYPPDLPISAKRDEIIATIQKHPVVVIAGETGSGKTTQLPKMCLEAGLGIRARVGCTQPRRVAALSLSRRVAEELNLPWGREVGCKIRFSDETSSDTYIKFMTDGILLAEAQADPFLSDYEAIIIDEAHERSLNIDFLLGCLKNLAQKRDDLKIIITSATIDTAAFARAFNNAPIIEVSGRMYPVEVIYNPPEEEEEEEGRDIHYVDAAVKAVEDILGLSSQGDVLVFLPGERDIREARDDLQGRFGDGIDIVPLFGRLSADEQQRVFAPSRRRKIVLATNIAETSLTVPGIHYVVDTGLARISRYNPRTRTKRLPIEPISQSSANQRKGRCGRVAAGVCFRLYTEPDFQARPLYSQPEIQRANLAEVILRMKAFKLGNIESFPFINPPSPQAIQGGYQLLQELGALDEHRVLTETGHELARLPVDPTIGRMILQARQENALSEVLVIAAGLSIQDPRERPAEHADTARAAQQRFLDPRSDFLTLLNIWNAYHDTFESMHKQNQVRRFCKAHFLSYLRMREWRDIHAQLQDALEELGDARENTRPADYTAIHRSILTGLWAHVAQKIERNQYQLGGNREVMVHPGSGLFERGANGGGKPKTAPKQAAPKSSQPAWMVAGEVVETSRLFLRTVAEIDPLWIVDLAKHLCKRSVKHPRWDVAAGRVLAEERVTLNGLEVLHRTIPYHQENPADATDIFIRSALVEEGLLEHFQPHRKPRMGVAGTRHIEEEESPGDRPPDFSHLPKTLAFLEQNHQLRQKIEMWQTRLPNRLVPDLDEAFATVYRARLPEVSSIADLNRILREAATKTPTPLAFSIEEVLGEHAAAFHANAYPDTISVGQEPVPLSYAYAPGSAHDGVTVKLPVTLAQVIDSNLLDWAVPALREGQILHLLESLPKELRRDLAPLPPKAADLALHVPPQGKHYLDDLRSYILKQYGVAITATAWNATLLPDHLRPRIEILGQDKVLLAQGRDLESLREQVRQHDTTAESRAWREAVQTWEKYELTDWSVGDIPERIAVSEVAGFPLYAYPALHIEDNSVNLRLFRLAEEAQARHPQAVLKLAEGRLQKELAWLQKDLRGLAKWRDLYVTLGPVEELEAAAFEHIRQHLFRLPSPAPRSAAAFAAYLEGARKELPLIVQLVSDLSGEILKGRHAALLCARPYPGMRQDLDALVPRHFLKFIPHAHLPHIPRYLKAMLVRAERAAINPLKDKEKAMRVQPFLDGLQQCMRSKKLTPSLLGELTSLYWLVQEFKVSCFAQELGTAEAVSPARLQQKLDGLRRAL